MRTGSGGRGRVSGWGRGVWCRGYRRSVNDYSCRPGCGFKLRLLASVIETRNCSTTAAEWRRGVSTSQTVVG